MSLPAEPLRFDAARTPSGGEPPPPNLAELLQSVDDDYRRNGRSSRKSMLAHARQLRRHFGWSTPAADITSSKLEEYQESRLEEGASPKTVNNELQVLGRGFALACRHGRLEAAPRITSLAVTNVRTGFLEPRDFRRLLEELPRDVRDLVTWLYLTGWRSGESKRLRWESVDLSAGLVQLPEDEVKNRRVKTIPLGHGALRRLIERRHAGRSGPRVFHRSGKPICDFRWSFRRAAAAIGRPGLRPHDLRRSFARNGLRAGVPQRLVMQIGGWRTTSMFHRYAIVNEAQLEEALDQVGEYVEDVTRDGEATNLEEGGAS